MFTERRMRYLWCVVTGGVVLMSISPGSNWMCQLVGNDDWNRWIHFFACLTVVVIPFAVWRSKTVVLLPLMIVMVGIMLEFAQTLVPGSHVQPQNALADLFGVGAGSLLGLNLRMMRTSAKGRQQVRH